MNQILSKRDSFRGRNAAGRGKGAYDIAIVGSGVSCAYTLIHCVALLEKERLPKPVKVVVFEKTGEFWSGVPYGSRSGRHALLISPLDEFLPDNVEREAFARWLSANRNRIFADPGHGDYELSAKWHRANEKAISAGLWDDVYVPRFAFGLYVQQRLTAVLERAREKGMLECDLVVGKVMDIRRVKGQFRLAVATATGVTQDVFAEKTILAIGSPANSATKRRLADGAVAKVCFVDGMYEPSLDGNIERIKEALAHAKGGRGEVLIVGANAGTLEALYCLTNCRKANALISKFRVISPDVEFPHRIRIGGCAPGFSPERLRRLVEAGARTARQIFDAVAADVARAAGMQVNIADIYGDISKGMLTALNQLGVAEQKKFVTRYGMEIGRLQRRAGGEYLDVVDALKARNRLAMLRGRVVRCNAGRDRGVVLEIRGEGNEKRTVAFPMVRAVICCAGFQGVTATSSPLIQALIRRKLCVPNASKRGFLINEKFEASKGLYVMGPLVAGNLAGAIRIWHAESCNRIAGISRMLAEILVRGLRRNSPRRRA